MKKSVAILYNSCWYVYLLRRNLIQALRSRNCEITVIAPEDSYTTRVRALGVKYIPIKMSARGTSPLDEVRTVYEIYKALREAKPDAVLSYTVKCNLYAGLCNRLLPFSQIANVSGLGEGFDGGLLNAIIGRLYRLSLGRTQKVFFQNPDDLASCVSLGLVPRESSALLPGSGVDLRNFEPLTSSRDPNLPRTFLIFGRLLPKKGFYLFLNAARTLREKYKESVVFWVLGSQDPERPESEELYQEILRAHAEGSIRYLQSTDDVRPFLQEATAVVLPSTYNEGVPRSLLEALAMGKPIVTTDWKGCRETVRHGINGYLVQPDNQRSLTSALESMIKASPDALSAMGQASRKLAEDRFDEQRVISAYVEALQLYADAADSTATAEAA
jgi:glycosyltransferase involved in cell wall biosynthesis